MSTISASTTSTTAYKVTADTTGTLVLQTGSSPTTAMTIDSSQNVGIGTSSPAAKLDVNGSLRLGDGNEIDFGGTTTFILGSSASNNLRFYTNNAERARIDSSGRLLVGTASSFASTAFMQVNTYQNGAAAVGFATKPSTNANYDAADFYNSSGTLVGYISCTSSTTSYVTSSDYRLKENVQPMTGALEKVAQLKPCTYTWKADGSNGQGFIAHELQAVVPECVTGEKDAMDSDGNPRYQGIDTSFLVATLTAAIQELKAELDAAKADIATLKGAA